MNVQSTQGHFFILVKALLLFKLYLNPTFNYNLATLHGDIGIKKDVLNDKFFILWYKRLGHIFTKWIKRLVKDRHFAAHVGCCKIQHILVTEERWLQMAWIDPCTFYEMPPTSHKFIYS